ncbi:UDP-4-amino-4,6-dideoxy-N-acetyl-beta-L-altrosamine transaminase [Mesorhizobium sp. M2D.F.Ca.ET.185.01.1.1]|uniref:UDP-4-amino-4, 6-dideoxy-N-acetyl-beta-L-altrosamine transaminase n=1 Tax=unclassified Mesorhizobium TaxID=325217 RepID=UPI000FCCAC1D|nr:MULTISPECIES: UDP-4-amino-4,6-dideoxy-N-acetyl-beta-L-altrosamine transaminase [unclassified Mesorhizobium]TGP74269.1 UDP-4-amino-4,6-dideoxy-N-acetyl-beta-L-altrosamine transaminase [bacterium M00.F.Ca.ET.227.01.1.1]TGT98048.1 UDP-4-amino-4,6-dideoxy-N-acetyl-beta-L-altrosamine transaminase [bacterium M00.F.Ca.ET.163.01.1.1]TGU33852.1 UDP-4-amino-4,6-dideoxy-N-acetyl-beta-L-altrosamine transaminase [bacterium M00.F.Ca.ET.156.01.1.1]TGU43395.1 UDP-4-amino-4,6-dideoxy-N-acetyl-beta-L-altrosam
MIRYGQQDITQADIDAVVDVLKSVNLTQGPNIPKFEQSVLAHTGARHAVAVNSATSALHIACLALGLGPGDLLWTTPNTFVASANCALYCGAQVSFVDVDPRTYNLCPRALEEKLIEAEKVGRLPKIVVPVHHTGQPCDLEAIHDLGKKYGFKIIEDASHAIGARYKGEPVGNGRYSDIAVFSFHPVKIVTTAEGGMALTNDDELATRLGLLRSHGITREASLMTQPMDGPWYYQQVALGYNYRMTDMQAALGVSQVARLTQYVKRRHEIADRYSTLLANLPLTLPWQHPDSYSAYHLYVIRLQLEKIGASHLEVFEALRAKDIMVNLHYIPVHTQPYYQMMGFRNGDYPEAERYYREAISIPMHPALTDADQDFVVKVLREAMGL